MSTSRIALNEFLCKVQLKALKQAEIAVGNRDDALDIVQDAMVKLAKKYSHKESEWPQLFQRILQNTIRDYFRWKKVRSLFVWWQQETACVEEGEMPQENIAVCSDMTNASRQEPHVFVEEASAASTILARVQTLPERQQQAFMLRAWMEYNVEETASAMGCSVGSVKTHYSRALKALKVEIGNEKVYDRR